MFSLSTISFIFGPHVGGADRECSSLSTASSRGLSEDWLAAWIGLLIFVLALAGLAGIDLLGWVVTTSVWTDVSRALGTASKSYARLGGLGDRIATYVVLLVVLTTGAAALRGEVKRFAVAFTALFWIVYVSWIVGNYAMLAAVFPADFQKFGTNCSGSQMKAVTSSR
jgi:hypothetical protein